jgi:hypothetical protein
MAHPFYPVPDTMILVFVCRKWVDGNREEIGVYFVACPEYRPEYREYRQNLTVFFPVHPRLKLNRWIFFFYFVLFLQKCYNILTMKKKWISGPADQRAAGPESIKTIKKGVRK